MSWGSCFFYYHCPACGVRFKYAAEDIPAFGENFGRCPHCGTEGVYECDGARRPDDLAYFEVEG